MVQQQEEELTRRQRDDQDRRVYALVGVSEGRLCVNITWYYLEGDDHWDFLEQMFMAAGFSAPRAITFEKNKIGRDSVTKVVDWNALRVSREQCDMAGVAPGAAANRIRHWMQGPIPWRKFKIRIEVGQHTNF
jgi:hypothetical protein